MKSLYSNNEFSQDKNYEFSNLPVDDINDFSWTQQNIGDDSLDFIINHHMKQKLPSELKLWGLSLCNTKLYNLYFR